VTQRSAVAVIDAIQRRAAADPRVTGLAGGLPAEVQFPKRALAQSFLRALSQAGAPALQYGWVEGSEGLRALVARRLRARGAATRDDEVIITNGAQQAIAIALELSTQAGDHVGVDTETYPAALELMRARRRIPVAGAGKVRLIYAMPAVSNPRGLTLDAAGRRTLLARHVPIIEDDAYADLQFAGPAPRPLIADAPDRVLHVGTFSKTLSPGLRIGWLITPHRLRRRALQIKQASDLQASSLTQAILEDYLTGGGRGAHVTFDERLVVLRRFYRTRAAVLGRALHTHLPDWKFQAPEGGFAIWAEAGERGRQIDEVAFLKAAVAARVVFDPGSLFRSSSARSPLAIRLCFSTAPSAELEPAMRRLARVYRRVCR
jgi:2-aminoadipate transaminase